MVTAPSFQLPNRNLGVILTVLFFSDFTSLTYWLCLNYTWQAGPLLTVLHCVMLARSPLLLPSGYPYFPHLPPKVYSQHDSQNDPLKTQVTFLFGSKACKTALFHPLETRVLKMGMDPT